MRRFKRGPDGTEEERIAAFWVWWTGAKDRIAESLAARTVQERVDEISKAVKGIDARLAWELAQGATSEHALVVSPEGDPAVRPIALRWLAAAPSPDATWEYHASRQPGSSGTINLGGVDVDDAEYRSIASWDDVRQRVDIHLWHPVFALVPRDVSMKVSYLYLDNLLGEDLVERWVGTIDLLEAPTDGRTSAELRAEIRRRSQSPGDASWVLAEGPDGLYVVDMSVKPIDHPFCQQHVVVTVQRGIEQLRESSESPELAAAEDELAEALVNGGGVHLGRITERRRRRIHFMCPDRDGAREIADPWMERYRRFDPSIDIRDDPSWTSRKALGIG